MASVYRIQRANWFRLVWIGCQYICAAANRSNAYFHTRIIVNKMIRKRIRTTKYKFVRGRSRCCFFFVISVPHPKILCQNANCCDFWVCSSLFAVTALQMNGWIDLMHARICTVTVYHSILCDDFRFNCSFLRVCVVFFSAERMNLEVTFLDIGNGFFPSCSRHCLFSLSFIVKTQSKFCYGWT